MKSPLLWAVAFLLPLLLSAANDIVPISQAFREGKVALRIEGRNDTTTLFGSSYYGECIAMTLENPGRSPLQVRIDPGQRLLPEDASTQEMIVTEQLIIALLPGQKKDITLFAMCGEQHDGAPGATERFLLGEMAREEISDMARFIFSRKYQNATGQDAFWVVTDSNSIETIAGNDATMVNELRQKAASITQQRFVPYIPDRQLGDEMAFSSISGQFEYRCTRAGTASLKLYDPDGEVVFTVFEEQPLQPGNYNFRFNGNLHLKKGHYMLRLMQDGVMLREKPIPVR